MCLVVDRLELRRRQLRISLRCREALVPKQLLDRAKVCAFFQQMRAKRMPQRVWMDISREPP